VPYTDLNCKEALARVGLLRQGKRRRILDAMAESVIINELEAYYMLKSTSGSCFIKLYTVALLMFSNTNHKFNNAH
jgi:hypothetical protein